MTTKTLSLITATLLLTSPTFAKEVQLEDISVTTATKSTQNIENVTSNIEVLTASQIEERGYTTVVEAISSLPGVSFTSNGGLGGTNNLYLRGSDSRRTLVLIDGIRFNDSTSISGAPFAHLLIANIAQIEVLKGAQSGVWGADASAGVINIITKKAKEGAHGSFYGEKGSFNTNKYGFNVSTATQNYRLNISHDAIDSEGFSAQLPKGEKLDSLEDDGYENKTTSIKLGIPINATNKIDIIHTMINADAQFDGFEQPNSSDSSHTDDTFTSINYNHIDSFNELNVYAKQSKFNRTFITGFGTSAFDGSVKEFGFTSKIPYHDEDFVVWGADYKKFEHKNSLNKTYDNQGYFVTNSNTFSGLLDGKTIFTQSLRFDKHSQFDNEVTGKLGLKHQHATIEGLTTSLNYGTAYNAPTLYQLYAPATSFGPIGNETLKPETTKSFDVSINYKNLTLTYFNNEIEDIIDYTNGYNNIEGTSTIKGFEASYNTQIGEDIHVGLNYTKLDAKDKNGKTLQRRPEQSANLTLDYYGIDNLHIGVDTQYVGKRVEYTFMGDVKAQTGNYVITNLTADYQVSKHFKLYGKVVNLTDKAYQVVDGYATSPRAYYLGLKGTF
ncbi:MAG: Outer membrane vitamin B12 receptor BtuB [uncultured Sulfurovum sp.]|uniref:Outer membrane vitamin B12 receptor BtuB n=1 Tax=uncultured Sulfurovum sp. TaxID=269237 RepID=A0A6S6UB46_9BACT|nr:MAG: Outer membrane vitamin B12 receptor BtuB [uncultured Sulfurovum sp.]